MKSAKQSGLRVVLALAVCLGVTAAAELTEPTGTVAEYNPLGLYLSHTVPDSYTAGQAVEVVVSLNYATQGNVTALGLTEMIPAGWTFQSMGNLMGGILPTITPQVGMQDELGFAWIAIPWEFPYQFSYFVMPSSDAGGVQTLSGQGEYRTDSGRLLSDIDTVTMTGIDKTPPKITLLGTNPMTVEEGTAYVEPGYTATDNADGNITSKVQVSGSVDVNTPDTYTLTYSVSDTAGNAATPVTRTVNVVAADNSPNGPGGNTTRRRRSGYGYGYYPGMDNATGQPTDKEKQATDPNAEAANAAAGTPGATTTTAKNGTTGTASLPRPVGGNVIPEGWPIPEEAVEAAAAGNPDAAKTEVNGAAPEDAKAGDAKADGAEGNAPASESTKVARSEIHPVPFNPPAAAVAAPMAEALAPQDQEAPPGFLAGIIGSLRAMGTSDWLRLGILAAVVLVVGVFGVLAWRFAYSPAPQRRPGNGNGKRKTQA